MEPEGPHTEDQAGNSGQHGNVVPFPGDWFGPREELVPFGAAAEPNPVPPNPSPPRAEDFWSEASAAIHDAVQAPVPAPPAPPVAPAAPAGDVAPAPPEVPAPPAAPVAERISGGPRRRRRPRLAALVAMGLVAATCAAIALRSLGPTSTRPGAQSGRFLAMGRTDQLSAIAGAIDRLGSSTFRAAARRNAVRHRIHVMVRRRSSAPAASSSGSGVPSVAPSTLVVGVTASHTEAVSAQAAPVRVQYEPPAGRRPTASASSAQPAGPVGPGAPFGPGHMG